MGSWKGMAFCLYILVMDNNIKERTIGEQHDASGKGKSNRFPNGDLGIFENKSPPIFQKCDVGTY